MTNAEKSQFQFLNYHIKKSIILVKDVDNISDEFNLEFNPKGTIDEKNGLFKLNLGVNINGASKNLQIEIEIEANFKFGNDVDLSTLEKYLYLNAPAILFPYIRAYIATLSAISGYKTLTLPTLNMVGVGESLKENTERI